MADAYLLLHPRGSAVVTQFSARPQLLVRQEKTHRASALTYGEAIFSPMIPPHTPDSIQWVVTTLIGLTLFILTVICDSFKID